jgi:guanine deaminase
MSDKPFDVAPNFRWVIQGNFVFSIDNPFRLVSPLKKNEEKDVTWLGPGLKLCLNHVMGVNHEGTIVKFDPASSWDLRMWIGRSEFRSLSSQEFVTPGFVDLHIHAPQYSFAGTATDRPLLGSDGWLETYTFPVEASLNEGSFPDVRKYAHRIYDAVVRKTLSHGTTTACYFATLHLEPCKILVDIACQLGQRALVGKVCMDRNSPENYIQSTKQNIQETVELIKYILEKKNGSTPSHLLPRIWPIITPRFIPTCTPELLTQLGKIAADFDCHIQSHISESLDEIAFTQALEQTTTSPRTDAEIFESHALLTDKCIMAHGVYLSDSDGELMHRRGAAVAHCPRSNVFFAGGSTFPCRHWMEQGHLVGLGTDIAGGYHPSILDSARMAVIASYGLRSPQQQAQSAQQEQDDSKLDYRHAFYLATLGGARALGFSDKIGSFAVGMEFDALIWSPSSNIDTFDSDTTADIFQKLMNLGDDRNVKQVFIQGNVVMTRSGETVTWDNYQH